MATTRLDLPAEALTTKQWWTNALYAKTASGFVLKGYTKPALRTFYENTGALQRSPGVAVTWVWYDGGWVRI